MNNKQFKELIKQGVIDSDIAEDMGFNPETGEPYEEYQSGADGESNKGPRTIHGLPVENEDGERLAFKNPKSGSESIHVAALEQKESTRGTFRGLGSAYRWSVCGFGSSRKRKSHHLYLSQDEFDDEYIIRDGEVVGKLCGRCRNSL